MLKQVERRFSCRAARRTALRLPPLGFTRSVPPGLSLALSLRAAGTADAPGSLTGSFELNEALRTLDALDGMAVRSVRIRHNPALCQSDVDAFVAGLDLAVPAVVEGNGPC